MFRSFSLRLQLWSFRKTETDCLVWKSNVPFSALTQTNLTSFHLHIDESPREASSFSSHRNIASLLNLALVYITTLKPTWFCKSAISMATINVSVTAMATHRFTRTTVLGERKFFQKQNITNNVTRIPIRDSIHPTMEIQDRAVRWMASSVCNQTCLQKCCYIIVFNLVLIWSPWSFLSHRSFANTGAIVCDWSDCQSDRGFSYDPLDRLVWAKTDKKQSF